MIRLVSRLAIGVVVLTTLHVGFSAAHAEELLFNGATAPPSTSPVPVAAGAPAANAANATSTVKPVSYDQPSGPASSWQPPTSPPVPVNHAPAGYVVPAPPPPGWQPVYVAPPPTAVVVGPPPPTPVPAPTHFVCDKLSESLLYTRIDYFAWNERLDGADFVNEDGALWTLGYQHQSGRERFRGEFFVGSPGYHADVYYDDGSYEPLSSHTNYVGLRGEYELLFNPEIWPSLSFYVGIGTRFWVRDLPDDFTPSGTFIQGYQETWWTVYPYIGVERRRVLPSGLEFYASSRIGFTAMTFEHASLDDVRLYPRPSLLGTIELGIRSDAFLVGLYCDSMSWGESPIVRGYLQPASTLFTLGLKVGFSF